MHSALLLVLSSLGAQAVPLLNLRTNHTIQRREEPYSIVNVGDQPNTDVPAIQTVVVPNPPQPPVTITVTNTPSATPSPCSSSVPGSYPPWLAGSLPTGVPTGESGILARAFNATERSARQLRRSVVVNGTESRALFTRHNATEPELSTRSDEAVEHAYKNGTARGNVTLAERAAASTRGLFNTTETRDTNVMARGLNSTSLHA
ncbi:hypothetical protein ATEIFO6365_0004054100 [Aspergillus terreus]|uniref:Uncharacterized protein n=1 Tax=Aspergillus terreus TaxID=33178 RepID=A0A5M3YPG9_ASPTE|nr:hypothetical protein ATETN484_0002056600 [Aspergillus terreus]GFF15422.1 hypothetical protein ATEIFO6365_0004054100 [Aspergillus terreus]